MFFKFTGLGALLAFVGSSSGIVSVVDAHWTAEGYEAQGLNSKKEAAKALKASQRQTKKVQKALSKLSDRDLQQAINQRAAAKAKPKAAPKAAAKPP